MSVISEVQSQRTKENYVNFAHEDTTAFHWLVSKVKGRYITRSLKTVRCKIGFKCQLATNFSFGIRLYGFGRLLDGFLSRITRALEFASFEVDFKPFLDERLLLLFGEIADVECDLRSREPRQR